MSTLRSFRWKYATALLATVVATAARADASFAAESTAFHVVRPGESLHLVAQRYLGDASRWKELHALNPSIQNPNLIDPGLRVRLQIGSLPDRTALVSRLSRQVDEKPDPGEWRNAERGDLLREKDGVRTYGGSSAALAFRDGRSLMITEDSLVFLRVTPGSARLRAERAGSIEIVDGQADLEGRVTGNDLGRDVEILVGGSRAAVKAGADGNVATRARKASGGAQWMVYQGASAVEAGGRKVEVGAGMGTVVAAGAAPSAPEKLLAAPQLQFPAARASLSFGNPTFRWAEVPGAAGYTLEVCADPRCGSLVLRRADLTATRLTAELPQGEYHWRVTARAASGLDGYPSEGSQIVIAAAGLDQAAPVATVSVSGAHTLVGDRHILGKDGALHLETSDDASGVASTELLLNGKPAGAGGWKSAGWVAGVQTASAVLVDGAGNRREVAPFSFVYDPNPPTMEWEAKDAQDLLAQHGRLAEERERRAKRRNRLRPETTLEWSSDGNRWLPLNPGGEVGKLLADEPMVFLRAAGSLVAEGGTGERVPLGVGRQVRMWFKDAESAVGETRLRVEGGNGAPFQLIVECEDVVGNVATSTWVVEPQGGDR